MKILCKLLGHKWREEDSGFHGIIITVCERCDEVKSHFPCRCLKEHGHLSGFCHNQEVKERKLYYPNNPLVVQYHKGYLYEKLCDDCWEYRNKNEI